MLNMNLFSYMFLVLFTCKILSLVTFSWWLVTAPLWAPVAIGIVVIFALLLLVPSEAKDLKSKISNIKFY